MGRQRTQKNKIKKIKNTTLEKRNIYIYNMTITYSKGKDQPDKAANPTRGQLKREFFFSLSPFAPDSLVS